MRKKIVILDGHASNPGDISLEKFDQLGELVVYDRTNENNIIRRLEGCDIAITNKTSLGEREFSAHPELRYVGVLATGYNVVDIAAANRHGVTVTNVPEYSTHAVSQHVFALLLEVCNRVGLHDASVHAGDWSTAPDFCYWKRPLIELAGKTMGIIGTGAIGSATARLARAFGMDVICASRTQRSELTDEGFVYVDMDELFSRADVISLHCALTEDTQNVVCAKRIDKMKKNVILINTARGGLVCEQDVANALNSDRMLAFASDVANVEPISEHNPLLHAKNCILTPHIAWAAMQTRQRLYNLAAENVRSFLDGNSTNCVN